MGSLLSRYSHQLQTFEFSLTKHSGYLVHFCLRFFGKRRRPTVWCGAVVNFDLIQDSFTASEANIEVSDVHPTTTLRAGVLLRFKNKLRVLELIPIIG